MTTYNSPFAGDVVQPTDVSYAAFLISTDLTLVWPVNGSNTTDTAARIMEITSNASNLKIYMPPANQVSVGNDALISVIASYDVEIVDTTGAQICMVEAGKAQYIYVTDNSTEAGQWGVIAFGATTTNANAAQLAGAGLLAIANTLNQSHPATAATNGQTFSTADRAQTTIWSGGAGSGTLGASGTLGNNWFMLFKNSGTGTFAMGCGGSDLIDGAVTKNFAPDESAIIVCTGSGFVTVGYGTSNLFNFTALVKPVVSGTYTLTASEASNTIQEYVGTLIGNVTAIYPPVVSLYVISNQTTSGGYSLTVGTGGGSTAVIPAGNQATVICDGTNFFNANTVQAGASTVGLVNGSVNAPSLNFAFEPTTGMYRIGTGTFGFTLLGKLLMQLQGDGTNPGSVVVTGSGTFTTGISGGTF
jgi:hypothetical protein